MRQPVFKRKGLKKSKDKNKGLKKIKNNKHQPVTKEVLFYKFKTYKENKEDVEFISPVPSSKLETLFEEMFLKKLKLRYIRQFPASNGRYYDFYLVDYKTLIEVDGDFYHCNPKKYDKPISPIQVNNKKVDEIKNKWAFLNSYILLRYWEDDIKNNPSSVLKSLKKHIKSLNKKKIL